MLSAAPASWDFFVALGGICDVERYINWKRHISKEKVIGNALKISHVIDCEMPSSQHLDTIRAEMLFANFFVMHNMALSAADHARHPAHASGKLNCEGGPYTLRSKSNYYA